MNFEQLSTLAGILLMWVLITAFILLVGGWIALASTYPHQGQVIEKKKHFQSIMLRWFSRYRNCVTIGESQEGVFLKMIFMFRVGHAPMFIPWNEIMAVRTTRYWGIEYLTLTLR